MSFRLCVVSFAVVFLCAVGADSSETETPSERISVSGTFAPKGPPAREPTKIAAGSGCIVELVQPYEISGGLTGTMTIDYRIMVYGPCGSPPGMFDEEWVAYGRISVTQGPNETSASLSYIARVRAGGDVEGRILLGQGVDAELSVRGNFADGNLEYEGWLK